jgi:hypothetical protein
MIKLSNERSKMEPILKKKLTFALHPPERKNIKGREIRNGSKRKFESLENEFGAMNILKRRTSPFPDSTLKLFFVLKMKTKLKSTVFVKWR